MAKFKTDGARTKVFLRDLGTAQFKDGEFETNSDRIADALRSVDGVEEVTKAKAAPVQSKDEPAKPAAKKTRKAPAKSKDDAK